MNTILALEQRNKKLIQISFYIILGLGVTLRSWQFFMGRSLWEDEAHLALNFISRDYIQLLKPLDYIQAAPPLFLWTVKTFTLLFGNGPRGLRLLPYLFSILSLPLFYHITREVCKSNIIALAGFFIFSVNLSVIYFSSELKTYGIDVAFCLLLIFLSVSTLPAVVRSRNKLLIVCGICAILYSNVAFIILTCLACQMMVKWAGEKKIDKSQVLVLLWWVMALVLYYFIFIYHHPYQNIQRSNYIFGFPPLPVFSASFNKFVYNSVNEICFDLLLYVSRDFGFAYVFAGLLLSGIITIFVQRRYALFCITVLPVFTHFAISVLRVYPFWYRLILYLVPGLILLVCLGIYAIVQLLMKIKTPVPILIFVLFCTASMSKRSITQFPLWFREIDPCLSYINKWDNETQLFITTPYTLYKYYYLMGKTRNSTYYGLEENITPEKYYASVSFIHQNYLLLHAADTTGDGYGSIISDLKSKGLIVKSYTYKTYTVSEIKPLEPIYNERLIQNVLFDEDKIFDLNGERMTAIWTGEITSKPMHLKKGRYHFSFFTKGTPVSGVYPQLNIYIDNKYAGQFFADTALRDHSINIDADSDKDITVTVKMTNDTANQKEDRNAFIRRITVQSAGAE